MKIRVTEFATSLKQAEAGDFQAYLLAWCGRTDPDGNLYIFHKMQGAAELCRLLQRRGRQAARRGPRSQPIRASARRSTRRSTEHRS